MRAKGIPLIVVMVLALAVQSVNAVQFLEGTLFQSRAPGGYLDFEFDFNATDVSFASDYVIFTDFENDDGEFGTVGFDMPVGFNVTVTDMNPTSITQNVVFTSIADYRVYTPDAGIPTQVTGAENEWTWTNTTTITMPIEDNEFIVISWSNWYTENDTYAEPGSLLPDLINQYLPVGDLSGFIISPYTMTMGIMFFPLVFLMFLIPSQQRIGVMMTAVLAIIGWTTIEIALFPEAINLINLIVRIAIAGSLVYLFFARRRQIG